MNDRTLTPPRLMIFAVLAVAAMGLSACSNKGSTAPEQTSSPTPSSPATTPAVAAGETLKAAAAAAAAASYSATYELTTTEPARTGTTVVYRTPFATRLDITTGSQTVQVYVTADGTFTCTRQASTQPMCVTLAGAGEKVAADVDPGLQHLFTSTVASLPHRHRVDRHRGGLGSGRRGPARQRVFRGLHRR